MDDGRGRGAGVEAITGVAPTTVMTISTAMAIAGIVTAGAEGTGAAAQGTGEAVIEVEPNPLH